MELIISLGDISYSCTDVKLESPFQRLRSLTLSAMSCHANLLSLQHNILLEGPRGSGKWTVAREVAKELGLHMQEVRGSCISFAPRMYQALR
jgi:Holliday junction resolvasome RuvABC ATP-dependent DNA helicase subunit